MSTVQAMTPNQVQIIQSKRIERWEEVIHQSEDQTYGDHRCLIFNS